MRRNSGTLKLTVMSPPQAPVEPLTVAEMKAYLRLPEYDEPQPETDALIASLITAARDMAEGVDGQNRDLVAKTWDKTWDGWQTAFHLRDPLGTVDLFQVKDDEGNLHTLTEGVDYIVDATRNLVMPPPNESWPSIDLWPVSAILIRFTTAPGAVPEIVKNGMRLLISDWHTSRAPFDTVTERVESPRAVTAAFRYGRYVGSEL